MENSRNILKVPKKLKVPVPDFTIDGSDENFELWTFRLPVNVPISSLDNVEIDMKTKSGFFQAGSSGEYKISLGDAVENDSFRVLVPAAEGIDDSDDDEEEDSDDDDEEENTTQQYLQPSSRPFTRHWNVVAAIPELSETKVAPRVGPEPVDPMRHAYSHIPQRKGLKRRWMPLGSGVKIENIQKEEEEVIHSSSKEQKEGLLSNSSSTPPPRKRIKVDGTNGTVVTDEKPATSAQSKDSSKKEKKAMKAEKKALKKAKKEAKKAKKEKRKSS